MSRMRPPLTTSMTGPLTTPVLFLDLLDRAPGPLVLGPLLGQDEPTLLVLLLEDEGLDVVAERHDLGGVDVVADRQLAGGDDALGLVADVEQDLVPVDLDDGALDDLAVLDLDHRLGVGIVERETAEVVLGDLAGDVAPLLVEAAHVGRSRWSSWRWWTRWWHAGSVRAASGLAWSDKVGLFRWTGGSCSGSERRRRSRARTSAHDPSTDAPATASAGPPASRLSPAARAQARGRRATSRNSGWSRSGGRRA